MAKLTLTDVSNLQNESTVVTALKSNNDATEIAMEATLSRDGQSPNQMLSNLDMNNYKVINLPDASSDQEPATWSQLKDSVAAVDAGTVVSGSYVTIDPESALSNNRVLTGSSNISVTDNGSNTTVTLDVNATPLRSTLNVNNTDNTSDATKNAAVATLTNKTIDTAGPNTIKVNGNTLAATAGSATVTVPNSSDTLVGRNTTDTLTNKTLTAPAISTISNSGTVTLPTGTRTLVARDTTDTLTNKTLTSPVIGTIVNTGTLTLPTATDTLVGRQTTDTLTNKTISGSSNTLSNIALSSHATQGAFTFVGNNTGSSAAPTAVDIHALTLKASPATTDEVIISDQAASGAWKRATVTSLTGSTGVSSIAGNTGAFTLSKGINNSTNVIQRALNEAVLQTALTNPTGTTSASGVMMGLGGVATITPVYSTRVYVRFTGNGANTVSLGAVGVQARFGTGTAPTNGAAPTGTTVGTAQSPWVPTANGLVAISPGGIITGLTPGTAYWFDLSLAASSGTSTLNSLSVTIMEF